MRNHWIAAVCMAGALAWAPSAVAKPGHHGKGHAKAEHAEHDEHADQAKVRTVRARPAAQPVVVIDRDGDRRIALDYFSRSSLPPGLARRESLPPGLAMQVRERGHLPPGLQKRLVPVPVTLSSRFRPLPPYYSRYFAGRDLLVVDRRSNVIVGVIPNVLPPR